MLDLQREQFEHDERFHREITRLTVHARLVHMALHFCKYTGHFAEVCSSGDVGLRSRTIIDSFIISLCSANTLNYDLSAFINVKLDYAATLRDIGLYLKERLYPQSTFDDIWLLITHATFAGKMARACEKIDHLEAFSFREELQNAITHLSETAIIAAYVHGLDLRGETQKRRREIHHPFVMALHNLRH